MTTTEKPVSVQETNLWKKLNFKFDIRSYTMIIALVIIWVVFSVLTEGRYLIPRNISNLSRQMSITAVLAIGMVMVIVATHIDLSVGSVLGLTGALVAVMQVWGHISTIWVILAALGLGILIGAWHGYWVTYQRVPAFIVTLASMGIFRGVILGLIKGLTVAPMFPDYKLISSGYLEVTPGIVIAALAIIALFFTRLRARQSRMKYGFQTIPLVLEILICTVLSAIIAFVTWYLYQYEGIPYPILIVIGLALIFTFITKSTQFGRQVFAMGGNVEAARLSGINVKRQTMLVFILASTMAAIAGILTTARLNAATTSAGTGAELDSIASCVIGGTSLLGGTGSIPGAILGALVMASIDNGLSMMNTEAFWQQIIKGLILLFAVWVDSKTKKQ